MENQDNLFNQIKAAADNAESPSFDAMDKVWHRVEEKLDTKLLKKENTLWKKIAVAASLLLIATLGYQFFNTDKTVIQPNESSAQADSIQSTIPKNKALVVADTVHTAIKKEAYQLLQKQLIPKNQVAYEDAKIEEETDDLPPSNLTVVTNNGYNSTKAVDKVAYNWSSAKKTEADEEKAKDVELYINKENNVSNAKKEMPLVVIDDKVGQKQNIGSINAENVESLVVLKDPLYIINGIYYTEKEVFGPNPTSPYAPLNEQEIESISVLQDEKAVALYGEKGKKGVVIVTTKDGKPKSKTSTKTFLDKNNK